MTRANMKKISSLVTVLIATLLAAATPGFASSMIEINPATPKLSVARIFDSKTFRDNQEEIVRRAKEKLASTEIFSEQVVQLLSSEVDAVAFNRVIDIEFALLSGMPDTIAICLEGHPGDSGLAIEACASTMLFISSITANVKYRWDLVVTRDANGRGHQLALGPGFGVRYMSFICWDTCNTGVGAELMGSLEYVAWLSPHFGLTAQLDLGGLVFESFDNVAGLEFLPMGKLTLGVAF